MSKIDQDLWDIGDRYPDVPGYKRTDTSLAAAQSVDAKTLRGRVLDELALCPGTADEIAVRLGVDKPSIRPRCSELYNMKRVRDTGERRENYSSGKRAIVWEVV